MICKKCGTNIEDNSKFCGVCGEKVEEIVHVSNEVVEEQKVQSENIVEETPLIVPLIQPEATLEQTSTVEPIVPQNNVEVPIVENVTPAIPIPEVKENEMPVTPPSQINTINEPVISPVSNKEPKKKNKAWIFVIL